MAFEGQRRAVICGVRGLEASSHLPSSKWKELTMASSAMYRGAVISVKQQSNIEGYDKDSECVNLLTKMKLHNHAELFFNRK